MNPESNQKRIAFGYDRINGRIVINEGQSAAVKLIYTWYAEGMSLGEIKKILEGMSVPSPQNKPTWGKQALSNILSNEHYLGSDIYPALVDDALFDAVQSINPDSADEVGTIDTSFIRFKKYYQRVLYETDMGYLQWLTQSRNKVENRNLLIMGHSLDITDKDIIFELIECASSVTVLYHSEGAKGQYISNLVKIFGREKFIQLRAEKGLTFLPLSMDFSAFAQERAEQQAFEEFCEGFDQGEIVIV